MSEQAIDLRSSLVILRRWRWLLALMTIIGIGLGFAFVGLRPPMYTSSAQVLLPAESGSGSNSLPTDISTEIRVAESDTVLGPAGESVKPHLNSRQVSEMVTVDSLSSNVLRIVAKGTTPAAAEALAQAVAKSEVDYQSTAASSLSNAEQDLLDGRKQRLDSQLKTVGKELAAAKRRLAYEDPNSPHGRSDQTAIGQLTAQQSDIILQSNQIDLRRLDSQTGPGARVIGDASPAERPMLVVWFAITCLVMAVTLAGVTAIIVIIAGRRDRCLRTRDEIADALGSPVLGAAQAKPGRNAAGWNALLAGYTPPAVDAWSLRQTLDAVGAWELLRHGTEHGRQRMFVVVVLADDSGALALAAQLAIQTADLGIRTSLTSLTRHEMADPLWASASSIDRETSVRPNLWVEVDRRRAPQPVDLKFQIAVVDRQNPNMPNLADADCLLLAVSSGAATEDDLARVAVSAYEAGGRFRGAVVADPDSLDRTTGRLLQAERASEVTLPVRLTGLEAHPGETRGGGAS